MFVVGIDIDSRSYFGCISIFIGVPTAIKIFNWCYSFLMFDLLLLFECFFIYMFIFMFLCGGITGLLLANVGIDILLHDTYFVVAHFHYVLSLGAVIGVFAGFCHFLLFWIPVELYLFVFYLLMCYIFLGSNCVFIPLHSVGLYAFPRRISDYSLNFIGYTMFVSLGLFFIICFCFILSCFFVLLFCVFYCFWDFVFVFLCFACFFLFFVFVVLYLCMYVGVFNFLHMFLLCCVLVFIVMFFKVLLFCVFLF